MQDERHISFPLLTTAAQAQTGMSYTEGETYYYTLDHIGRPFNLRDEDRDLRWFENHYPFGEIILEDTPGGAMSAGSGCYTVSWTPSFRFPGQYGDSDQFPFVQNHFREYLPEYGNYSRIDPKKINYKYSYTPNNPVMLYDPDGRLAWYWWVAGGAAIYYFWGPNGWDPDGKFPSPPNPENPDPSPGDPGTDDNGGCYTPGEGWNWGSASSKNAYCMTVTDICGQDDQTCSCPQCKSHPKCQMVCPDE